MVFQPKNSCYKNFTIFHAAQEFLSYVLFRSRPVHQGLWINQGTKIPVQFGYMAGVALLMDTNSSLALSFGILASIVSYC